MGSLKGTYVHLDVVELEPMDTGMVTVDAEAMGNDIDTAGHVAIYGIHFDTGKAVVKSESRVAIDEIVKLMNSKPGLKLFIVGHTDNRGEVQYNMDLSHRRAQAVRDQLVNEYGIDTQRLGAVGMGLFAPVKSNQSEAGRAENRRVELVEWNE
jgi:OmpA-OmpF porin, OOP family